MNMMLQVILFVLSVLNIVAISVALFKNKSNLALGLALVEILLVSAASA